MIAMRARIVLWVAITLVLGGPTTAQILEYPVPLDARPFGIVAGPDDAMWFTNGRAYLGRITSSGVVTLITIPSGNKGQGIISWHQELWFTENISARIGKYDLMGGFTEFVLSFPLESPDQIVEGPDDALWFTNFRPAIGRINRIGSVTEFDLPFPTQPKGITLGPDAKLWYVDVFRNHVGSLATNGAQAQYGTASRPYGIATGSDGALWFTEPDANRVARFTTSGTTTEFPIPGGTRPEVIVSGPDGALWIGEQGSIVRIDTTGHVTRYSIPTPGAIPGGLAFASDGSLWFTEFDANKIGHLLLPPLAIPAIKFEALLFLAVILALIGQRGAAGVT
jgi:virginiamycin B lyase